MIHNKSYYVVLDANIWVSERLLQSAIGKALIYALSATKASIGLPEVVEKEVNSVLPELAEKAIALIGREASLLRQLSGHKLLFTGPTSLAIRAGIDERWKKLSGLIVRVPFTLQHAQASLDRIIAALPPCGTNNEQFRDCCIWLATLSLATECEVHLITQDNAFFEGRKLSNGLAKVLSEELERNKLRVSVHSSVREFLTTIGSTAALVEETAIGEAIIKSVTPYAREIAGEKNSFHLCEPLSRPKINGFATPTSAVIAVSFELSYAMEAIEHDGDGPRIDYAKLSLEGACSYDPNSREITDVEIRTWSKSIDSGRFTSGHMKPSADDLRQYAPGHFQVIGQ